jgi:hypothetical protein
MVTHLHLSDAHPSRLLLPVRAGEADSPLARPLFGNAPEPRPQTDEDPRDLVDRRRVVRDEANHSTSISRDLTMTDVPIDAATTGSVVVRYVCTACDMDPAKASLVAEHRVTRKHGGVTVQASVLTTMESDATAFHLTIERQLCQDGVIVREDTRQAAVPRDLI